MNSTRLAICAIVVSLVAAAAGAAAPAGKIHSVVDISHEFSFYFDGRFAKNYLAGRGNASVQNWGTLHKFDFDRVNLVVLQSGASSCRYTPKDIAAIKAFLDSGGGVIEPKKGTGYFFRANYEQEVFQHRFCPWFVRPWPRHDRRKCL